MNITKNIIDDLMPLYAANECSPDTRALIDEYLREHPREAGDLQRILNTPPGTVVAPAARLNEMKALREARRRLRRRQWLMGFAIFFSLAPLSFFSGDHVTFWMLRDAPASASVYGAIGVACWIAYAVERSRAKSL